MDPNPIITPPLPREASAKWGRPSFFLSFLVFLLLLSTAYLAYQNMQLKKQITALQYIPTPTPSPIVDETANLSRAEPKDWKTYTNEKYGYSLHYPPDWATIQNPINDLKTAKESFRISNKNASVYISIFSEYGGACQQGYQKIVIDKQSHDVCIYDAATGEKVWEQITFKKGTNTIELRAYAKKSSSEELLIPQILSTFRFLDSKVPTSTCTPRPACLDATPMICMIAETEDMCPKSASTTCQYQGKTYTSGEAVPSGDTCNSCSCDGGQVACTEMFCE